MMLVGEGIAVTKFTNREYPCNGNAGTGGTRARA
jgi:hypothetical protein